MGCVTTVNPSLEARPDRKGVAGSLCNRWRSTALLSRIALAELTGRYPERPRALRGYMVAARGLG